MNARKRGKLVFRPLAEAKISSALAVGAIDIDSLVCHDRLFIHYAQRGLCKNAAECAPIGFKALFARKRVEGKLEVPEIDKHLYADTVLGWWFAHLVCPNEMRGRRSVPGVLSIKRIEPPGMFGERLMGAIGSLLYGHAR